MLAPAAICLLTAGTLLQAADKGAEAPSPWSWRSRLRLEACYDETVIPRAGRSRDAVSSFCATLAPRLQLRFARTPDIVDMIYDGRFLQYQEVPERNSMMHRLSGRWNRKLNSRLSMRFDDRITYRQDTGGENDENITRPATYLNNAVAVEVTGRLSEHWQSSMRLANEMRVYDDESFDNWYTLTPSLEVAYLQKKNCRWTLSHEFSYLSVEDGDRERTHRTLAGYACTLPYDLRFDVRAGILAWGDGTTTDPAGDIRLSRRWSKAGVALRWQRSASVSSGSGRVVRRDYILLQPSYRITPKTRALGRISMVIQESLDDNRIDTTTWRSGLVIRRELMKRISADVAYTYVDQTVRGRSGTPLSGSIVALGMTASF